ncbi:MAG TPA: tail fiber domain-containing protein [Methanosarcina sp.]|nr:tail fiber domain-containing protein [Methanosarcina sp.]
MTFWSTSNYQPVDVGISPNDGSGDNIRNAFIKVDNNFANISSQLSSVSQDFLSANIEFNFAAQYGNITNLITANLIGTSATLVGNLRANNLIANTGITSNGTAIVSGISYLLGNVNAQSNLTVTGQTYLLGNTVAGSHITPSANIAYDLGSPTNYFRNIYSQGIIQVNTVSASSDAGLLKIHANLVPSDVKDIGIFGQYWDPITSSNQYAYFGRQNTSNNFVFISGVTTDATTGNNIVVGGFYGNAHFGSQHLSNTTAATSTTTGALIVSGGAGIAGNLYAGHIYANISSTVANLTSVAVGNVAGSLYVDGNVYSQSYLVLTTGTQGIGNIYNGTGSLFLGNTVFASNVYFSAPVPSTSTNTGAVILSNGGLGVAGNVNAGAFYGPLYGTIMTAAQPNITSLGALPTISVGSGSFTSIGTNTLIVASTATLSGGLITTTITTTGAAQLNNGLTTTTLTANGAASFTAGVSTTTVAASGAVTAASLTTTGNISGANLTTSGSATITGTSILTGNVGIGNAANVSVPGGGPTLQLNGGSNGLVIGKVNATDAALWSTNVAPTASNYALSIGSNGATILNGSTHSNLQVNGITKVLTSSNGVGIGTSSLLSAPGGGDVLQVGSSTSGLMFGSWNASYAGIWNAGVTPSTSNYGMYIGIGDVAINSATQARLNINAATVLLATSTGVAVTGALSTTGNATVMGNVSIGGAVALSAPGGSPVLQINSGNNGMLFGKWDTNNSAMWNTGVTPIANNYSLLSSTTASILNSTTNTSLRINDTPILAATSSGVAITGSTAVTGAITSSSTVSVTVGSSGTLLSLTNTNTSVNQYSQLSLSAGAATSYIFQASPGSTNWAGTNSLNIVPAGTLRISTPSSTGLVDIQGNLSISQNVTTTGITASGYIRRSLPGVGYLEGNYGSAESPGSSGPIYTIGGAYQPTATTLGNMYGIGYAYSPVYASAIPGYVTAWGMYVASNGVARIFFNSDSGSIGCTGSIAAGGDITAFATSDKRLKTNILPITNALSKVGKLNGFTYTWNDTAVELDASKNTEVREAGLYAQEVEDVLAEVVTTRDNGYKAVRYEKIVPLLVEAIKDLKAEKDTLQEELSQLRDIVNEIKGKL